MKKLLYVFLILFLLTSCKQEAIQSTYINTKNTTATETGVTEVQGEAKKEESVTLPKSGNNRLIVIDAGHQRYGNNEKEPIGPGASETKPKVTSGASGVNSGKLESQINLEVALKLQAKLEVSGYQVIMIRTSQDINMSNRERAEIANSNNAAAFIRIHCNSADTSSAKGVLTIAPSTSNRYCSQIAESSQTLSKSVLNNICSETSAKNRGLMISDVMSGINWCKVPVTIVEMGFLSNPEEDRLLCDGNYQDKIVTGIVKGINEYLS